MKSIGSWNDLPEFGIVPLTGEACGLSYRILCDVTEKGNQIIEKAFGVRNMVLHAPWNSGTQEDPHIGSILLAPEMLIPVGAFALLENGCTEVWQIGSALVGFEPTDSDEELQMFRQFYEKDRRRILRYAGTAGDRNVHQMSGRIA